MRIQELIDKYGVGLDRCNKSLSDAVRKRTLTRDSNLDGEYIDAKRECSNLEVKRLLYVEILSDLNRVDKLKS